MSVISLQYIADNLPELLVLVAEHLAPCDILSCMATCKTFAVHFEPCLWQHLTISNRIPPLDLLLVNRHRVHTIAINPFDGFMKNYLATVVQDQALRSGADANTRSQAKDDHASQPSSKLHTITFGPLLVDLALQRTIVRTFASVVYQSPCTLRTLTLPAVVLMGVHPVDSLVQDTFPSHLPNLQHLTINNGRVIPWHRSSPFLVRCFQHPRLVSLYCGFFIPDESQTLEFDRLLVALEEAAKSKQDSGASRIKDLRLPWSGFGYTKQFLIPFLQVYGPSIETMEVPSLHQNIDDTLLQETIKETCPNLRHLSVYWRILQPTTNSAIAAIIRGAVLQSIRFCGVKWIQAAENSVGHHATSLEDIEFEGSTTHSEHQRLVLERCPKLKRMWVQPDIDQDPSSYTIYASDCQDDWKCLGLKELRLTYRQNRRVLRNVTGTTPAKQALVSSSPLYKQIGRLVHLEVLAIGVYTKNDWERSCYEYDLTTRKGWLNELRRLKKLRRLHISTDLWTRMGQEEVEFMHQSWPVLQRVTFECSSEQFKKIKDAAHWRWLRRKWPRLQLDYGCCRGRG